ncbi:MAG: site-specific integrase [Candidatus Nitrosopolaris sp.]
MRGKATFATLIPDQRTARREKVVRDDPKIDNVTKGLQDSYYTRIKQLPKKQRYLICDYMIASAIETKMSDTYRQSILNTVITLARSCKKAFKDFIRTDVVAYMNYFKKDESEDPKHKWIGTHNTNLVNVIKFFRWLYSPDTGPTERPKPAVVQNLHTFRRKETSVYDPSDMWDAEDNYLFLKYCPNARDQCYHAMEVDTGARPHELLNLRIKDVEFIEGDGGRYAKILVNGKTGQRSLVLIDSFPYVTQWISNHPQGSNREAILLPSMKTGKAIRVNAMFKAYKDYKEHFTSLLSENIPEEDKKRIRHLLKKRWNPYVHRHTAITEKSSIISSDVKLRQFAGWTPRSNMHYKYVHFRGNESQDDLLRAKGIIKDDKESVNILQFKTCPHCREPNKPDAQFCFKCHFIMSFEAYQKGMGEKEKKNQEILELKEQMNKMQKDLQDIKEFELQRLKDPNYGRKKQQQEVADEMKRTGKDLITVLSEKLSIDSMISPKMMESIKKLPRTLREIVVEKLIALVKDERGYEETHPEIKKIKGLLVDVDVDTTDVTSVSEEDRMCYKLIEQRFNLEAAV